MTTNKSFFASLFDFSFSNFVAPRIVGIIYGLSIVGVILALLGMIVGGLVMVIDGAFFSGLITIIVSPIVAVVYLLFIRVALEGLAAGIVTAKNSTEIREYVRQIRNENG